MNAPLKTIHIRRATPPRRKPIDSRYQHYETLKRQLTVGALTPAEYDAAVREAARRAGV